MCLAWHADHRCRPCCSTEAHHIHTSREWYMSESTYAFVDDNCCGARSHTRNENACAASIGMSHRRQQQTGTFYTLYLMENEMAIDDYARDRYEPRLEWTRSAAFGISCRVQLSTYYVAVVGSPIRFHFFLGCRCPVPISIHVPILTRIVIFGVGSSFLLRTISSNCWQPTNLMQQFGVITLGLMRTE